MDGTKADNAAEPVLCARGLYHRYGGHAAALGPVDLDLFAGRITALVGPNGAGKSTLLRLLAGLLPVGRGTVSLGRQPIERFGDTQRARKLALCPQRTSLAFAFTVREYVGFGAFAAGSRGASGVVDHWLDRLDLGDLAQVSMPRLSVGQQQRAAIARALAQLGSGDLTGKVLLADEPASALDTRHASGLVTTLKTLAGKGLAVLVAAHDLPWAAAVAEDALAISLDGVATKLSSEGLTDPHALRGVFGAPFERFRSESGDRVVALPGHAATASPGG